MATPLQSDTIMPRFAARFLIAAVLTAVTAAHAGVTTFSPQGEVKEVTQIRASFDASMIAFGNSAAPAPFNWSCQLKAKGHWVDDKTWVLDVSETPQANTDCRFSLRPGLKDRQGNAVAGAGYRFFTGPAVVTRQWPDDGQIEEDQAFVLQFNGRAEPASTLYCQSSAVPERLPVQPLGAADRNALLKHLNLEKEAASIATVRLSLIHI